ncbi:MAG: prolyl-tRNA synthetase associated domain-containing protein [Alphaproteobacteria bacterium]|nr:prolyl-tRNA synthetase associated domain-containing protein [Alphaproteobacteria bacterium]MCL2504646.1 prolyl-tRNA synthetase associated domain-containing protein [Alphaproteobacteria bacterium]
MYVEQTLLKLFDQLGINYDYRTHEPVFTCEQANAIFPEHKGVHCKNLFVKDRDNKKWLLVIPDDRRADLKSIAEKIGSKRLSFCSAEEMQNCLGVTPGAATPLAVINDTDSRIDLIVDEIIANWDTIRCHPLTNTATVSINMGDFRKFIRHTGHNLTIANLIQ